VRVFGVPLWFFGDAVIGPALGAKWLETLKRGPRPQRFGRDFLTRCLTAQKSIPVMCPAEEQRQRPRF
jgi:hypothetical protein